MNRLDQLLEQQGRPTLRGWPWLIMALLAAFLIWAYVATLERVVVAEGEVAPQGRVKVIQHLEGGVIEAFHVAEGDRVASGDPLSDRVILWTRLSLTAAMQAEPIEVMQLF